MSARFRPLVSRLVPLVALTLVGCARPHKGPVTPASEPAPAPASEAEPEPPLEQNTFVSTSYNEAREPEPEPPAAEAGTGTGEFAVTTADAAREIAEAAVAEQLDPRKTWLPSPVFPSAWPARDPAVVVFFYPMAASPSSMTEYQLYTPAFRVTVSLTDATTAVRPIGKRRKLGTIQQTRPSSLERRELELAEKALISQLTGGELDTGGRPYWGYLKYIHEHPKIGRDLERRMAKFIAWVRRKHGR